MNQRRVSYLDFFIRYHCLMLNDIIGSIYIISDIKFLLCNVFNIFEHFQKESIVYFLVCIRFLEIFISDILCVISLLQMRFSFKKNNSSGNTPLRKV